ncbi:DEAD/DEAH box helicase [Bradyrhizobium sp. 44]|nr:DEAD/DEAH box helicase [Bradyrhizobium sp. 44]
MREALASYIEATYHLSNASVVDLRRQLLTEDGIAQVPYIESTPTYVGERKFSSLALSPKVRELLTTLASKEAGRVLFNPPYEHQAQALELAMADDAGGTGIVVTTGTGSGKTESFLLPIMARLADEALQRPNHFANRAVRALLLYPMNALVAVTFDIPLPTLSRTPPNTDKAIRGRRQLISTGHPLSIG